MWRRTLFLLLAPGTSLDCETRPFLVSQRYGVGAVVWRGVGGSWEEDGTVRVPPPPPFPLPPPTPTTSTHTHTPPSPPPPPTPSPPPPSSSLLPLSPHSPSLEPRRVSSPAAPRASLEPRRASSREPRAWGLELGPPRMFQAKRKMIGAKPAKNNIIRRHLVAQDFELPKRSTSQDSRRL